MSNLSDPFGLTDSQLRETHNFALKKYGEGDEETAFHLYRFLEGEYRRRGDSANKARECSEKRIKLEYRIRNGEGK